MEEKHVYVTQPIPAEGMELLKSKAVKVTSNWRDRVLPHHELKSAVKDKDAVFCLLTDKVDKEILESANRAKIFADMAVGYNNIDVETATRLGIFISNTPGVLTETTADLTWALIMAVTRKIIPAERFLRDGRFTHWGPLLFLGTDLYGRKLGILGAGRIGSAVARRARAFNLQVLYTARGRKEELEQETGAVSVDLDTLLKESDILTIHAPLTQETHHLIGKAQLAGMKPTAFLINTARGGLVDEGALAEALKNGRLQGAGLDVYEQEPKVHPALMALENVVLLPHIGSATRETRGKMATMAAENIIAALAGERPPNLVNTETWQER